MRDECPLKPGKFVSDPGRSLLAIATIRRQPSAERLARTVSAHLLDLGYDASFLLSWASALHRTRATAVDVIEEAARLACSNPSSFDVVIVLLAAPERPLAEQLPSWLDKTQITTWLKGNGFETADLRGGGGFRYRIDARDAYGAAHHARQLLARMVARSSFLRRSRGGIVPAPRSHPAGNTRSGSGSPSSCEGRTPLPSQRTTKPDR